MRLAKVQIRDFRCIEDSGEFSIAPITCLVGKNESGKTAILKALHRLKPDDASKEPFNALKDYPRRKWRSDARSAKDAPVIQATWELSEAEFQAVEEAFGKGVLSSPVFTASAGYDNVARITPGIDHERLLRHVLGQALLSAEEREPLARCASVDAAMELLKSTGMRSAAQEKLLAEMSARFPQGVTAAASAFLLSRMPTFLYFDEYLTLPGTIAVNEIAARQQADELTAQDRIFIALLELAGSTVESVNNTGTYEEFNASLRAVSNQLTDMIAKYWSQNKHLDVEIKLDYARPSDPAPFNAGWIFRTRIDNRRHRADTSFDDRSRGFIWFFSFLIWFYQLKKIHGENLVILLDEPGHSLHARAQADLLRYINEQLKPHYQVIYTTHSPFMVDADNLLSARTVEDVVAKDSATGEELLLGTKVSESVLTNDADTIAPLRRALEFQLAQSLFVGKHTLLVEGESDVAYLKWFSKQLQAAHKCGLDYRWNVCIGGGLARIPSVASLLRNEGLHIAAITDIKRTDNGKVEAARKSLPDGHLVTLDTYAGQSDADMEDVLGRSFYLSLVRKALDLRQPYDFPELTPADTPARVMQEVEQHTATLNGNHRSFTPSLPAEWLFHNDDEATRLPGYNSALDRMERLIGHLNELV